MISFTPFFMVIHHFVCQFNSRACDKVTDVIMSISRVNLIRAYLRVIIVTANVFAEVCSNAF